MYASVKIELTCIWICMDFLTADIFLKHSVRTVENYKYRIKPLIMTRTLFNKIHDSPSRVHWWKTVIWTLFFFWWDFHFYLILWYRNVMPSRCAVRVIVVFTPQENLNYCMVLLALCSSLNTYTCTQLNLL